MPNPRDLDNLPYCYEPDEKDCIPMPDTNRIAPLTVANAQTDKANLVPTPEVADADIPLSQLGFTIDKKWRGLIVVAGVFVTAAGAPVVGALSGVPLIIGVSVLAGFTGVLALLGYRASK